MTQTMKFVQKADIGEIYSGVSTDGKMILTPQCAAMMSACYVQNGYDASGRAMDSAAPAGGRILHCACDAPAPEVIGDPIDPKDPPYYNDLQAAYNARRGQPQGAFPNDDLTRPSAPATTKANDSAHDTDSDGDGDGDGIVSSPRSRNNLKALLEYFRSRLTQ